MSVRISFSLTDGQVASLVGFLNVLKDCNGSVERLKTSSMPTNDKLPTVDISVVVEKSSQADMVAFAAEHNIIAKTNEIFPVSFPMVKSDLDVGAKRVLMYGKELDADHPGFKDEEYRKRRLYISNLSECFQWGMEIPQIEYTEQENETWSTIYTRLKKLYSMYACRTYLENFALLEREGIFNAFAIPQLNAASKFLKSRSGFQIYPVAGYLSARDFLAGLAFRVFHATQYIRHPSHPFYSPEPDVCHELLGHVPMFANPEFAQFSQEIGLASLGASDEIVEKLAKLYFFIVEFGLCMEGSEMKVFGAGILSSAQELKHVMEESPTILTMEVDKILEQECIISSFQNVYFVCNNLNDALTKLRSFTHSNVDKILRYDPYKEKIEVFDDKDVFACMMENIRQDVNGICTILSGLKY